MRNEKLSISKIVFFFFFVLGDGIFFLGDGIVGDFYILHNFLYFPHCLQ